MRVPLSWLRELVRLPESATGRDVAVRLIAAGLEVETVTDAGRGVRGEIVVGMVAAYDVEEHSNGKTIRWCTLDIGREQPQQVVCGADNFAVDDLVVAVLPGAVLPGGFEVGARRTYGHTSAGMICSTRELGLATDDAYGILVLDPGSAEPGDDAIGLLGLRDEVLDIAVSPDRGYCLSMRGIAREAATAYGIGFGDPADPAGVLGAAGSNGSSDAEGYPVRIEDPNGCGEFVARSVTGIDAAAVSPRWLQRRLQLSGMRPVSVGVDAANYVMLEFGQPLHGYDAARLSGPIVARRANPGEKLRTLDDQVRALDPDDLVIADDSGVIGLAGLMGGQTTELGAGSSEVVIEAAHFEPTAVARTSRRHRLSSEAARRFERGVDPLLPRIAAARAAQLLAELAGGTVAGETAVGGPAQPPTITMPLSHPAAVAGAEISDDRTVELLEAVGCTVIGAVGTAKVTPPSWRPDLNEPNDLAEEVIRLFGYDNVPTVPTIGLGGGLSRIQRRRRQVGAALAGAGFTEVTAGRFVGDADLDALGMAGDDRARLVRVANPMSGEEPWLPPSLLPGLLRTAERNVGRGSGDLAIFQTGLVFRAKPGRPVAPVPPARRRPDDATLARMLDALPDQPEQLGLVLTGNARPRGWWGNAEPANWAAVVQTARLAAAAVGSELQVRQAEQLPWHSGRCAALLVATDGTDAMDGTDGIDGTESIAAIVVGHAGELHPKVCQHFGLPARTAALELDLGVLLAAGDELATARPLSNFPVAKEDVALIVDAPTPAGAVADALRTGAGELLESIALFDVYTGDQIAAGRKSLAFALRFRAADRTLTEAEVATARQAAVDLAVTRFGAVHRAG